MPAYPPPPPPPPDLFTAPRHFSPPPPNLFLSLYSHPPPPLPIHFFPPPPFIPCPRARGGSVPVGGGELPDLVLPDLRAWASLHLQVTTSVKPCSDILRNSTKNCAPSPPTSCLRWCLHSRSG